MKRLLISFVIILGLISCEEPPQPNKEPIVIGVIMNKDNGQPFANTTFLIQNGWTVGLNKSETQNVYFTTDQAGKFATKFNMEHDNSFDIYWPDAINENEPKLSRLRIIKKTIPLGEYPDTVNLGVLQTKL